VPLCLGTAGIAEKVRLGTGARVLLYSVGSHGHAEELAAVLDGVLADLERHCDGRVGDDVVLVLAEHLDWTRAFAEPSAGRVS